MLEVDVLRRAVGAEGSDDIVLWHGHRSSAEPDDGGTDGSPSGAACGLRGRPAGRRSLTSGKEAVRQADGTYLVPSAHSGQSYTVRILHVAELAATCTCPHGRQPEARGLCWHIAAALIRETQRLAAIRTQSVKPYVAVECIDCGTVVPTAEATGDRCGTCARTVAVVTPLARPDVAATLRRLFPASAVA